jgi:uncharacterized protein with HEPN domain
MWRDASRLQDMIFSARLIREYVRDVNEEQFLEDLGVQDKVIRRLTILGEAAKNVSGEFRSAHPSIAWREIAGLRDVVVHQYPNVRMERIWQIVHDDIPALITALEPLIPSEED